MNLKVVKFDRKMYVNFSNFQGQTSAGGGGQALVQKRGQVSDGGIGKIFAGWGDPHSPQEKTLLLPSVFYCFHRHQIVNIFIAILPILIELQQK